MHAHTKSGYKCSNCDRKIPIGVFIELKGAWQCECGEGSEVQSDPGARDFVKFCNPETEEVLTYRHK